MQAAEAMFKEMDTDGNGALDTSEFQCKCSDFGLEDAAIEALFITLDTNSDGQISLEEFTGGVRAPAPCVSSEATSKEAVRSGPSSRRRRAAAAAAARRRCLSPG